MVTASQCQTDKTESGAMSQRQGESDGQIVKKNKKSKKIKNRLLWPTLVLFVYGSNTSSVITRMRMDYLRLALSCATEKVFSLSAEPGMDTLKTELWWTKKATCLRCFCVPPRIVFCLLCLFYLVVFPCLTVVVWIGKFQNSLYKPWSAFLHHCFFSLFLIARPLSSCTTKPKRTRQKDKKIFDNGIRDLILKPFRNTTTNPALFPLKNPFSKIAFSSMTTVQHGHSHTSKGACNSASCNSPSRLWRSIQTMIHADDTVGFSRLCQDTDRAQLVSRVLTTQRLANDASLYPASHKHRVVQFEDSVRREALQKFGKSLTDLNALQLALILRREAMATLILTFLQQHASPTDLQMFLNHVWGKSNTSMHLACFWGMPRLVRRLLDLGADESIRNARQLGPIDCCTNAECLAMLKKLDHRSTGPSLPVSKPTFVTATRRLIPAPVVRDATPHPTSTRMGLQRPSMLLKKAMKNAAEQPLPVLPPTDMTSDYFAAKTQPLIPIVLDQGPLFSGAPSLGQHQTRDLKMIRANSNLSSISFSSSSSSSSFSSLSSLEESLSDKPADRDLCWSPPSTPPSVLSFIHDDEDEGDDAWKSEPPSLSSTPSPSPSPVSTTSEEPGLDGDSLPLRPACFPTMRRRSAANTTLESIAPTTVDDLPNVKETPIRQVRFDSRVILADACVNGDLAEVARIFTQDKDPETDRLRTFVDDLHSRSLLHIALLHGNEKIARYLVNIGRVDTNHADNDGWTALHYTTALGLWKSLEYLASLPETLLNARTKNGLTVYDCAKTEVDRKKCRVLIERAMKRRAATELRCEPPNAS